MLKAVGVFFFYLMSLGVISVFEINPYFFLVVCIFVFYGIPFLYRKWRESANRARWQRQDEQDRINRANAEEQAHQTALRRERERLEMHAEIRIKELIGMLEVQYHDDTRKLQRLETMKTEFANRQQSDMASLLGRLEAMKAGK